MNNHSLIDEKASEIDCLAARLSKSEKQIELRREGATSIIGSLFGGFFLNLLYLFLLLLVVGCVFAIFGFFIDFLGPEEPKSGFLSFIATTIAIIAFIIALVLSIICIFFAFKFTNWICKTLQETSSQTSDITLFKRKAMTYYGGSILYISILASIITSSGLTFLSTLSFLIITPSLTTFIFYRNKRINKLESDIEYLKKKIKESRIEYDALRLEIEKRANSGNY